MKTPPRTYNWRKRERFSLAEFGEERGKLSKERGGKGKRKKRK